MKAYEVLYIIDNAVTDEKREEIVNKVKALVENNGGKAQEPEKWGLRKFAYPIAYKNDGYYVLMNFEAPLRVPQILNTQLLIMEGVVRFMVSAK